MSTEPGSDPIGDFQRWLMKAGARSLTRDVADRVKSTLGGGNSGNSGNSRAGVWETATTEAPTDEPPECQWCPICRAARRARDSGGSSAGFGEQLAGVGDALAGLTRDAFSLFETALRTPPTTREGSDDGTVVRPGVGWPTVVHPEHENDEAAHERGDREEGGEPGDAVADGGGDEQVEGTAE